MKTDLKMYVWSNTTWENYVSTMTITAVMATSVEKARKCIWKSDTELPEYLLDSPEILEVGQIFDQTYVLTE